MPDEPYSALMTAAAARLVDASGPFVHASQVRLWIGEALDDLAPSEELVRALHGGTPRALVCYDGAQSRDAEAGGATDSELVRITVRYAVAGPAGAADYATPLTGDGAPYWGLFGVYQWIRERLDRQLVGADWVDGMKFREHRGIAIRTPRMAAFAVEYEMRRVFEDPA